MSEGIVKNMPENYGNSRLKVSVCMVVYNHEKFLAKALDSILSQKCDFAFEIVVGEDCSPDDSRAILRDYEGRYPTVIKPLYHEKNLGSTLNVYTTLRACTGEYIAFCEGDDYWIDDSKLQLQIDFLEANPDFSMCFTDVEIEDNVGLETPFSFPKPKKDVVDLGDLIITDQCIVPTATLTFRNILPKQFPPFFWNTKSSDIALHLMLLNLGKLKRLDMKTAVYRIHHGGITRSEDQLRNQDRSLFRLYESANEFYNFKYDSIFRERLLAMAKAKLIFGAKGKKRVGRWKHAFENFPDYIKYSKKIDWKEAIYYLCILLFPSILRARARK